MKLIILWILVMASNIAIAQPGTKVNELLRDRYTVSNGNYGHPYTIFDKNNDSKFDESLIAIRNRIKNEKLDTTIAISEKVIFSTYKKVYDNALSPRPTDDGMPNTGISGLTRWAKSNAFVTLVCLNGNAYTLSLAERDFVK
jgi:hypothetical protein